MDIMAILSQATDINIREKNNASVWSCYVVKIYKQFRIDFLRFYIINDRIRFVLNCNWDSEISGFLINCNEYVNLY